MGKAAAAAGAVPAAAYLVASQATAPGRDPSYLVDNLIAAVVILFGTGGAGWVGIRWLARHIEGRVQSEKEERRQEREREEAEAARQRAAQQARLDDLKAQIAGLNAAAERREAALRAHYEREVGAWKELLAAEQMRNERFAKLLWSRFPAEAAEIRGEYMESEEGGAERGRPRPASGKGPGTSPG